MSIPKEPRQLMINLMYLVLTALLALNVSAEVMNAFFSLDRGLKNSNAIVDNTNAQILANINKQADAYKNEQNEAYRQAAIRANELTQELVDYVQVVWDSLFNAAGGPNPDHPEMPKRKKDKDITTRLLVLGPDGNPKTPDALGYELERRIRATRDSLLKLVNYDSALVASIPLEVEEDWKKSKDKVSWADWKFRQMPVAAVFPLLRKIQTDAKTSNTTILNYLFKQVSGEEIKFDAFEPVVSARKSYVIKGEKYVADVFLSAYSTSAGDNTEIYINGKRYPVKDGKATYEVPTSSIGTKKYKVEIRVKNPLTGEVKTYTKEFEYEVGERSIAVSADKMNVFYIGVDNPVTVSAAGIPTSSLRVSIQGGGGSIKPVGSDKSHYIVRVTQPTDECYVVVSGGGVTHRAQFRVKRIPDPVARLGKKTDGSMGNGEFKAQPGVLAWLDNFDFDAKCEIAGFTLTRVQPRKDPVEVQNRGGRFQQAALRLVRAAKPGDVYYFDNVRARCPGDKVTRKINSMVFRIQ